MSIKDIEKETQQFALSENQLKKISSLLVEEFSKGLSRDKDKTSCLKMIPTYVRDLPDGTEEGKALGMDVGGTNCRIFLVDIKNQKVNVKSETDEICNSLMVGPGEKLFDHLAQILIDFLDKQNVKDTSIPLGFTFSFPCEQQGLACARLVEWTKGFKCADVQGKDVGELLREALKRKNNTNIDLVAILNDTTGTLMTCAYKNKDCSAAVLNGTGTNACYVENLENIKTWTGDKNEPKQMIINTEWGAFGDNGCIDFMRTDYDRELDVNSLNPGKHLFEKMVSGMYLGEIVRLVICKCVKQGFMLDGQLPETLKTPYAFKTTNVSSIDGDEGNSYENTRTVFRNFGVSDPSDRDCDCLKQICSRISTRSAHLVASGIAAILEKTKHTGTIGVDGALFKRHPFFMNVVKETVPKLVPPGISFNLELAESGGVIGAAFLAVVVTAHCKSKK